MKAMNGVRLLTYLWPLGGLGDPFACHMEHIGLDPHPKSKQALKLDCLNIEALVVNNANGH
jgi:hypothetical protein